MKKFFMLLFVVLIAVSFFGVFQVSVACQTVAAQDNVLVPEPPTGSNTPPLDPSQTAIAQEKAMDIIQNVMLADLSKYALELQSSSIMDGTPLTNDNRKITNLRYALTPIEGNGNENSIIQIYFTFEKDVVTSYYIMPVASQIIATTPYNNQRAAVTGFLEKCQTYTNIDSNNLITLVNNVDLTKKSTITQENTKLTVTPDSFWGIAQVNLRWTYTVNGADYTALEINVNTRGFVTYMYDDRALYTIGDTSVNVSMEQAIDIALENLKYYSYDMYDGVVVSDFNVSRNNVVATLVTSPVDYELRPYWDVKMMLDEVYPGNVHGIAVGIWADTGDFSLYSNMAYGGVFDLGNNDVGSEIASLNYTLMAIVATVIVVAIVVVVAIGLMLKKRQK